MLVLVYLYIVDTHPQGKASCEGACLGSDQQAGSLWHMYIQGNYG